MYLQICSFKVRFTGQDWLVSQLRTQTPSGANCCNTFIHVYINIYIFNIRTYTFYFDLGDEDPELSTISRDLLAREGNALPEVKKKLQVLVGFLKCILIYCIILWCIGHQCNVKSAVSALEGLNCIPTYSLILGFIKTTLTMSGRWLQPKSGHTWHSGTWAVNSKTSSSQTCDIK